MLKQRLKLGRYFGIPLYVHWSLGLIVAWFGYQTVRYGGSGADLFFMMALLATMYLCVTLHEYGHSLMARRFGVNTVDITLLPIGGIARLERMPRIPWQELLVAVAGPAVNVVIAVLLSAGLLFSGLLSGFSHPDNFQAMVDSASGTNLFGFVWAVLALNIGLVLFNLVPAFPMDGGRVFRSLLAMVFEYRRATWIAARVGLGCAVLMAGIAYHYRHPVVLLIAFFIAWAGVMEARQVDLAESVRGIRVADAMIRGVPTLAASLTVQQAAAIWIHRAESALPVADASGQLVGLVRLEDVARAIKEGKDGLPLEALAHQEAPVVWPSQSLDELLVSLPKKAGRQLPVMGDSLRLVGLLDLDSIVERAGLQGIVASSERASSDRASSDRASSDRATASAAATDQPPSPQSVDAPSEPRRGLEPLNPYRAAQPPADRLGDGPSYLA